MGSKIMIRIWQKSSKDRGVALLTVTIIMMMVAMLGLAYITLTSTNLLRAGRDERRTTAFYLAEAGLEYIIDQMMTQGTITTVTYDTSTTLDSLCSSATGSVVVTADSGGKSGTLTSSATYRGITERVRVRLKLKNIGTWNNAIFAGIGASGRGINGNVDIRGSVHILGDGEPYSDLNGNGQRDTAEAYTDSNSNGSYDAGEPFTDTDGDEVWSSTEPFQDNDLDGVYDVPLTAADLVTEITGNANVGNNYNGMPDDLRAKIPSLVRQSFGGEMVDTLDAEVRVKHGKVNIDGNGNIGELNETGNTLKETMDGCFVTDGYTGNKGASSVYSDNGTSQKYDLGDRMSFPSLDDEYTDSATSIHYDHFHDYLEANSLEITDITKIDNTVASFTRSSGSNSIAWNQGTGTLTISGIVRFHNNTSNRLDLGAIGTTINYTGRGTIYTQHGTVYVHGNILPTTVFPTTDVMGVIAGLDIEFATGPGEAQLSGAGAWFAQRTIKSAKQNKFAGTYVANYFDMGTNVPSIYQVPELVNHMPPGMPGGEIVVVTQTVSWRHLSQSGG